jgi:predicted TIM-barrel fold metal-dependent hydrolase
VVDLVQHLMNISGEKGELTLRGELQPRPRRYPVISVDDHLIEPPTVFAGRMPARFVADGPRVERDDQGVDWWVVEDHRIPLLGADAIQSWEPGKGHYGPVNFDELRPAVWNIHERIKDMDVTGVLASLSFPSAPFGFAGQRLTRRKDPALGLAALRAFNDWVIEDWAGPYPDRIIPCQIPWMEDAEVAAAEDRATAARGFKAVSFSENPEKLGLPSLYSGEWDPVFAACQETGTVVNLHVGSSSQTYVPSTESPGEVLAVLFPVNSFAAAADWLFARIPVRFPELSIVLSEGGIGWVPTLVDRLDYLARRRSWDDFGGLSPLEVFRRNFSFTTFFDPRSMSQRHEVGLDHIMVETDYPHSDSTFPDTQDVLASQFDGLPADEVALMSWQNAARIYRHTPPDVDTFVREGPAIG